MIRKDFLKSTLAFISSAVLTAALIPVTAFANNDNNNTTTHNQQQYSMSDNADSNLQNTQNESNLKENSFRYTNGILNSSFTSINPFSVIQNVDGYKVFNWFDTFSNGYCSGNGAAKVIDVSEHNGDINWTAVKKAGVNAAIIRCGYGQDYTNQDDKKWKQNIHGALKANIPVGVYLYSYADNTSKAKSEAEHVLRCLKEEGISTSHLALPIFYDIEDSTIANSKLSDTTKIFCETIQKAGYTAGVYSSSSWWDGKLTSSVFDKYARWVAAWNASKGLTSTKFSSFKTGKNIWQFSDAGSVPGITGAVDLSYTYISAAYGKTAAPGEKVIEDGTYEFIAKNTNYCLDVKDASTKNKANVRLYTRNSTKAQRFKVTYDNKGYYTIINENSGKALDVDSASSKNGTNIHQWTKNSTDAQKWRIDKNQDGSITFTAKCNNKALDITNSSFKNGSNVQCWTNNDTSAQKFTYQKLDVTPGTYNVTNGTYIIKSALSTDTQEVVLDIRDASLKNKANVQLYPRNDTKAQQFKLAYDTQGFYRITAVVSGKSLDVENASNRNSANVQQWEKNQTDAQKWKIQDNGDGTYTFISKCSAKALDVKNGSRKPYANVDIYQLNNTAAQKWYLVPYVEPKENEDNNVNDDNNTNDNQSEQIENEKDNQKNDNQN